MPRKVSVDKHGLSQELESNEEWHGRVLEEISLKEENIREVLLNTNLLIANSLRETNKLLSNISVALVCLIAVLLGLGFSFHK